MFLSWVFRHGWVTAALFFWAASTTFTRLYLGVHYLGDVLVGMIVGCLLGAVFYLILRLIQKRMRSKRLISEQFTSTGYMKSDMTRLLDVIFFNYVLLVIIAVSQGVN